MSAELKPNPSSLPVKIQEYTKTALALTDLSARYGDVVFDVSHKDGMKAAKDARAEIKTYRVELEKTRVAIKADALEQCRIIDSEAKQIKDALEALEIPINQQIKAEEKRQEDERIAAEKAEIERFEAIQKAIASLRNLPNHVAGQSSADIRKALAILQELEITQELYAEYVDHAHAAKTEALTALEKMATDAEALEAERAELARLRAEAEARVKAEQLRAQLEEASRQIKAAEMAKLKAEAEAEAEARAEQLDAKLQSILEECQADLISAHDALRKAYDLGYHHGQADKI